MSPKKGDEIVQAWCRDTDRTRRVLLFSAVGTTGYNLADAALVIHFVRLCFFAFTSYLTLVKDQNWSLILDQQIDGRAWRLGQKFDVLIYHILALGTTDTLMHSMANEKDAMLLGLVRRDCEKGEFQTCAYERHLI